MRQLIPLLLILCSTLSPSCSHHGQGEHDHDHYHDVPSTHRAVMPTRVPDHVILQLTETDRNMAIAWRTSLDEPASTIEWALASHGPEIRENPNSMPAKSERFEGEVMPCFYHTAVLEGLEAGEKYAYRVGNGSHWTEWYQFDAPDPTDTVCRLVYFGDAQNDIRSMWSRIIREAYREFPKVDFMLHAGDLVNTYDSDEEWSDWFYAGGFIHSMIPSVMTPGNHEVKRQKLSPQWKPQFILPENGPDGHEETCYYLDYKNIRLISLNSPLILRNEKSLAAQRDWLESVLKQNDREWTILTLHHPFYSTKPERDNDELQEHFQPLIDEFGVDLVLQGHDHAYGRGHNVPTGTSGQASQTMYVVSVSGPKMYDVREDDWMERRAKNTQLFQYIEISGSNELVYEAYTAKGDLYDRFLIRKSAEGEREFINEIPDLPERAD